MEINSDFFMDITVSEPLDGDEIVMSSRLVWTQQSMLKSSIVINSYHFLSDYNSQW